MPDVRRQDTNATNQTRDASQIKWSLLEGQGAKTGQHRILVVDDSAANRKLLCKILSGKYETLEACDGQEALNLLREDCCGFSLILLDIIMPIMDGYAFLDEYSRDPDISSIPVIVTTQKDSDEDEIKALAAGAYDFITKPYKPQIIAHRVSNIIKLRETAAIVNVLEYDSLTGLYSKEFFYRRARQMLDANPGKKFDIICSDIENFKLVNDMFGIAAGDTLLQAMADTVKLQMEGRGICGRIGADIFAYFVVHVDEEDDEEFEKLTQALSTLSIVPIPSIKYGIYCISDTSVPVNQMCDRALLAVEKIKGKFGESFAFYDDAIRQQMLSQQAITEYMETALQERQFKVFLQPKYNLKSKLISGAEALVRWDHPENGFMYPGEFVPLFEKSGFITRLDIYVWEETAKILRHWMDSGLPSIPISVNVSRADIFNSDLPSILLGIIEKYDLEPKQIHLEITESAYTDNPKQIVETVSQLSQLGFIIEMDDFGTGYSSLNMLNALPIDVLKLDIGFIQSENTMDKQKNILGFIIDLAKGMNLLVIAEGVETLEQIQQLQEMNCDYVQGYYYARPMPYEEFLKAYTADKIDKNSHNCSAKAFMQKSICPEGDSCDFMDKLVAYGLDLPKVMERFVGDKELYQSCFQTLIEDKNFAQLGRAVAEKRYEDCHNHAHTLKGVVGNLGLPALYTTICDILESLRNKQYSRLEEQHKAIMDAFEVVKALI